MSKRVIRKVGKKRRTTPLFPLAVKAEPELVEPLYAIADKHFNTNVSEALREAIRLLIQKYGNMIRKEDRTAYA